MNTTLNDLRDLLGEDAVLGPEQIAERATSYWDPRPMVAAALVRPRSTSEVSAVLRYCHAKQVPVVPQGGLTNCVEGTTSTAESVMVSMERFNRIEEIDEVGGTATVQAGVVLQTLQEAAADCRLSFPVDLGPRGSCTIGGIASTNAGGINVIRYGMTRNWVLGLEAVLADGTILSSMNRMIKNNAGYDLKQLFLGSEGTLGIITRLVLRLRAAPSTRNSAMVAMTSFDSVVIALRLLQDKLGGQLSAYEVMWGSYYRAVTKDGWHCPPLSREYPFYVMLETEGANGDVDKALFESVLAAAMDAGLIADAVIPQTEAERTSLWHVREDFSAIYEAKPVFLYDVSLPIKHMGPYVADVDRRLSDLWPRGFLHVMGHIGDGNLHLLIHPGLERGADLHEEADREVYQALLPFSGSISAEHGIGVERLKYLSFSRSDVEIGMMKTLKRALDPLNILNPGKVIDLAAA